jgi:solute carrier family 25 iron transporter 28/37
MEGLKGFSTLVREWQGMSGAQRFMSSSVVDAVRRIVAEEGLSALLRGLRPRVLFHTPAAAICWSTYEAGKSFLSDCD